MNLGDTGQSRPDIVAATRGGDDTVGMDDEADPVSAILKQALFSESVNRFETHLVALLH
jgi:hypothetical protein